MEERNQPRRPRRDAEQPQQKSESLIYGKNPVTELLKSGSGVDTVLIAEGMAPAVAAYYTALAKDCLLYTSPSPRDRQKSRMPSSA